MKIIIFLLLASVGFTQVQKHHLQVLAAKKNINLWYVDRDAGGNDDGTSWTNASPTLAGLTWASIFAGDTVYISGGADSTTYSYTDLTNKGVEAGTVVITGGWETNHDGGVYFNETDTTKLRTLFLSNTNNVKFVNLNFYSSPQFLAPTGYYNVQIYSSHYVTFDNCHIWTDGHTNPVFITFSHHISLTNNTIDVESNSYPHDQDPIQIYNGTGGHTITGNTIIMRSTYTGADAYHRDAIQMNNEGSTDNYQTVIANNFIYMNESSTTECTAGIFTQAMLGNRFLIYNNLVVLNTASMNGITIEQTDPQYDMSVRLFNNTVVNSAPNNSYGITIGEIDTLIMKNNIVVSGTGNQNALWFWDSYPIDSMDIDYNQYYKAGNIYVINNGSNIAWGDWQALGFDGNSDTSITAFANLWGSAIVDYLTTTGRDIGAALSTYFTTDINGYIRPYNSVWDFGAIEYNP